MCIRRRPTIGAERFKEERAYRCRLFCHITENTLSGPHCSGMKPCGKSDPPQHDTLKRKTGYRSRIKTGNGIEETGYERTDRTEGGEKVEEFVMTCTACRNQCEMRGKAEKGEVVELLGNGCMRGLARASERAKQMEHIDKNE